MNYSSTRTTFDRLYLDYGFLICYPRDLDISDFLFCYSLCAGKSWWLKNDVGCYTVAEKDGSVSYEDIVNECAELGAHVTGLSAKSEADGMQMLKE